MNERDIAEQSFNNGYEKGYADGKAKVMSEIAFPRLLVRQPELSKKDVEDILMQSPTIIMDKTEIIPIYPYRWIPVTERLPENTEMVLICSELGNQYVAQHFRGHFYSDGTRICTSHWMPLPEPPKGE